MKHFDKELRHLADNGYRSAEDWASLGRDVPGETPPRTTATLRGRVTDLYTRDQTRPRPRAARPDRAPPAAAATPA